MSGSDEKPVARWVERARDPSASLHERHGAFTHLVRRFQGVVFAAARTALGDPEEARDVAQSAFATAWHRLDRLRDPAAFPAWLRTIVLRECASRGRRSAPAGPGGPTTWPDGPDPDRTHQRALVASALAAVPESERRVLVLHYFEGHTLREIGRMLGLKPGTVGKRLHSARLRIRRGLPRSVREDFLSLAPSEAFVERVRLGLLDAYVGWYRFDGRPDHLVSITRLDGALVSTAGGQQHVLVPRGEGSMIARHYDGEGRFFRDRHGAVTHFVYYEHGRRMGVARRFDPGS